VVAGTLHYEAYGLPIVLGVSLVIPASREMGIPFLLD